MIARPETPKAETIFGIEIKGDTIALLSPSRNDDVISLIKPMKYNWNGYRWQRTPGILAGRIEDRAVELGCKLLAAGFTTRS